MLRACRTLAVTTSLHLSVRCVGTSDGNNPAGHSPAPSPPSSSASQQAAANQLRRAELVEDVLGFQAAKTEQLMRVLSGKEAAPAAPPVTAEQGTVEDALKRPAAEATGLPPTKKLELAVQSARLKGALSAPVTSALDELEAIVNTARLADGNAGGESNAPPRLFGEARRHLGLALPLNPKTATVAELARMVAAQPLLQTAVACMLAAKVARVYPKVPLAGVLDPFLQSISAEVINGSSSADGSLPAQCRLYWLSTAAACLREVRRSKSGEARSTAALLDGVTGGCARGLLVLVGASSPAARSCEETPRFADAAHGLHVVSHACDLLLLGQRSHARGCHDGEGSKTATTDEDRLLLSVHCAWLMRCISTTFDAQGGRGPLFPQIDKAVTLLENLWHKALLPPLNVGLSSHHTLNHRTIHSSLNLDLAGLPGGPPRRAPKSEQRRASSDNSADTDGQQEAFYRFWVATPAACQAVLSAAGALAAAAAAGLHDTRLVTQWATTRAVVARTCLNVETKLLLAATRALGMEWGLPTNPSSSDRTAAVHLSKLSSLYGVVGRHPLVTGPAGQERWNGILSDCDALRVASGHLVHGVYSAIVMGEMGSGTSEQQQHARSPSRHFLSKISTGYFPLARRHYLCTQGFTRGVPGLHQAVLGPFLDVFLLLKTTATLDPVLHRQLQAEASAAAAASPDGDSPAAMMRSQDRNRLQACGTSLGQALEVAYFLSFLLTNGDQWPAAAGGSTAASITADAVQEYVKEALYALGHNTAKQLWHLRSSGALHFFTGQKRDKSFVTEEHVRRRHVQSTLGVVHAHVMHPSLLWMPLWQVQEMVSLFANHTSLFYEPLQQKTGAVGEDYDNDGRAGGMDPERQCGSLGEYAEDMAALGSRDISSSGAGGGGVTPAFTRATVTIGGQATDLARVHGYLVLRLYVVSNVLRAYRDVVAAKEWSGDGGETHSTAAARFEQSLTSLEKLEPAAELRKRRDHRRWAKHTAAALFAEFPTLPADSEGLVRGSHRSGASQFPAGFSKRAAPRCLRRMETAVSRSLASHLFINAIADMKRRRPQPRRTVGTSADTDVGPATFQTVELLLTRPTPTTQLGFVLEADTAVVTRVADELEEAESPFSAAAVALASEGPSPGLPPQAYVGWRVVSVDGHAVTSAREVGPYLAGKLSVRMTLSHPSH